MVYQAVSLTAAFACPTLFAIVNVVDKHVIDKKVFNTLSFVAMVVCFRVLATVSHVPVTQ